MLRRKSNYQTYTDGWGTSWETDERKLVSIRQKVIHFQEQTVGEGRYWDAAVAGTQIERAVKVPFESKIGQGDIFVIQGKQYKVVQKDLKDDRQPVSWLLSLALSMIEFSEKEVK